MRKHLPTIISAIAVVAMMAIVFFMSDKPVDESRSLSMGIVRHVVAFVVPGYEQLPAAEQAVRAEQVEYVIRKMAHFSEFALLGALAMNLVCLVAGNPVERTHAFALKAGALTWAACTAFAASDEFHQLFVAGRTGKATDVVIDSFGVLAGIAVFLLVRELLRLRQERRCHG